MAEIDIQRKRTPMWPWILGIIVAVVLIVFLVAGRDRPSEMPYGGGPAEQPGEQSQPAPGDDEQFQGYEPAEEPGIAPPGGRHPVNLPQDDNPGTGGGPDDSTPGEGVSPDSADPGAVDRPAGSIRTDATSGDGASGESGVGETVKAQVAGGGPAPDHLTHEYPRQGTTEDQLPATGIIDEEHPAPGVPRETRPDLDRPFGSGPDDAADEQDDQPVDEPQEMPDDMQGGEPEAMPDDMQEGEPNDESEVQPDGVQDDFERMQEDVQDEYDETQENLQDEYDETQENLQDEYDETQEDLQDEFDDPFDAPQSNPNQGNPNGLNDDFPDTTVELGDELERQGGDLGGISPLMVPGGVYPIPVETFVEYVEDGDTRQGGYDQEYTGDGIRQLADALYELGAHNGDRIRDADERRERMLVLADRLQASESGQDARPVYQAFIEAAEWMNHLQQTQYPQVGDYVQAVREAAQGIDPDGLLREQREEIQAFFHRSQEAIEALGQAASEDHPDPEP